MANFPDINRRKNHRSNTVPNRPPEDYMAEANLCRKRAAECLDKKIAAEWLQLAREYDRMALIAESKAIPAGPGA